MANTQKSKKTESDEIVLINRGHSRKYVPYGEAATGSARTGLGIPGAAARGVATLHLIHPGINGPISRDRYDSIASNPKFKQWLEEQTVYVLDEPLNKLNPDSCGPLLARSSDVEGLKYWLANEERKEWVEQLREMIMKMDKHAERTSGKTGGPD